MSKLEAINAATEARIAQAMEELEADFAREAYDPQQPDASRDNADLHDVHMMRGMLPNTYIRI